eukprot:TRINITY_DN1892_c0_g3_i2.p1 TRINITY_DN1892_c0_g3~~TRINITY_DN1892_c0_g3_i2.p1  ORF type:complete len:366 (+),score=99.32 TRINITY_DN1892_c0_g3_i2:62-1159(+)
MRALARPSILRATVATAGGFRAVPGCSRRLAAAAAGGGAPDGAAAAGRPGGGGNGVQPAAKSRAAPGLVSAAGVPLTSSRSSGGTDPALGADIELTAQNAAQILQNPGAILLQVGEPGEAITKKIARLRLAASGRLPLVRLDCQALPQICQALQIASSPCILLLARGQVALALENDLSPPTVTAFVERTAGMLGLKVNLAEGVTDQLAEAEETEWSDATAAEALFGQIGAGTDLPNDARIRVAAGRARCALRQGSGRKAEAQAIFDELDANGHGRTPEAKQLAAMLWLDGQRSDVAGAEALGAEAADLFWSGRPLEAVDAALKVVRKQPKEEEAKKLARSLVEALGPRHPQAAKTRRRVSSAFFV